jgi:hypothetical protein
MLFDLRIHEAPQSENNLSSIQSSKKVRSPRYRLNACVATIPRPLIHQVGSSGTTAMASTSTNHSGLAKAETTIPVETGKTPFSHFPMVR